jgi:hypothetical protein
MNLDYIKSLIRKYFQIVSLKSKIAEQGPIKIKHSFEMMVWIRVVTMEMKRQRVVTITYFKERIR